MNSNAQKFDCTSKTKEYQDLIKSNKVAESYNDWNEVRKNCPTENEAIYTDGITILDYKIDNVTAVEEKEKLVREEMSLYDQYYKNFSSSIPQYEALKAMALYNRKIEADNEIVDLLNSAFTKAPKSITEANVFYTYFNLNYAKYKEDSKTYTSDMVLDKYMQINTLIDALISSNPTKSSDYKSAQRGIHALAKDITNCDILSAYYEKRFDSNKNNGDWLTTALANFTVKCSGQPIYNAMAEANYKLKATTKSAYYLANSSMKQRKFPEAIKYFTEAEALETNPLEKAKLDYSLATGLLSGDKPKAKELLLKAVTLDPKMGRAYLFLAELYSNSAEECGQTPFQKKAIYYLAQTTINKAALAEPILKTTVQRMTESLSTKSLTPTEITNEKMNGKSMKIGCWINETVTFPSN
jgi:hypothetical protein